MNENTVNTNVALLLYRNRVKIVICCVVFAIISGVITSFIPKKYMATGTIYSTQSNNIKNEAKDPNFGLELQADKLTQLFNSEAMFDHIVDKFELLNYYEIDTSNIIWYDKLRKNYFRDISIMRNQYLSLTVTAVMKDAKLAADIVNDMIVYIDTVRTNLYLQNTKRLVKRLESKIDLQQNKVDSLLQLIFEIEGPGVYGILGDNRLAQIEDKKNKGIWELGNGVIKDAVLNRFTPEMEKRVNEYYYQLGILNNYKLYYSESIEKIELPFPNVYTVSKAQVNNKKTNPSLFLNILLGIGFGFIVSVSLVLMLFKWKTFKGDLN